MSICLLIRMGISQWINSLKIKQANKTMSICAREALLRFPGGGVRCITKKAKLYWIEKQHKNCELTFLSRPAQQMDGTTTL